MRYKADRCFPPFPTRPIEIELNGKRYRLKPSRYKFKELRCDGCCFEHDSKNCFRKETQECQEHGGIWEMKDNE